MSEKSISNRSLKEIMELSTVDVAKISQDDIIREVKLQFTAGHVEVTKRINRSTKKVQVVLLDMENFEVNKLLETEISLENDKTVLDVLTKRFNILFPGEKLDILS